MTCAGAAFWDQYFRRPDDDLDWGNQWIGPFLVPLRQARAQTILDLGCGTGNNAARLADEGFSVAGADLSAKAIK